MRLTLFFWGTVRHRAIVTSQGVFVTHAYLKLSSDDFPDPESYAIQSLDCHAFCRHPTAAVTR